MLNPGLDAQNPKVAQFHFLYAVIHQYVARLDVTVNNFIIMEVSKSTGRKSSFIYNVKFATLIGNKGHNLY